MYRIKITNLKKDRYFQNIARNTLNEFPIFTENKKEAKTFETKKEAKEILNNVAKLISKISIDTEKEAKSRLKLEKEDAE